jgi:CDP-glycerol glycerophosphotransferase (TagB/SpsB family)
VTHVITVGPGQVRFLEEIRESVRHQTYRHSDELVVAWGPDTAHPGIASARADGIRRARGRYARLVEASDVLPWHSTALLVRAIRGSSAGTAAGYSQRSGDWRERAFSPAPGVEPGLGDRIIDLSQWRASGLDFWEEHGRFADATMMAADARLGCHTIDAVTHEDRGRALGLPFGHVRVWSAEADSWLGAVSSALGAPEAHPAWAAAVLDHRLPVLLGDVERLTEKQWRAVGKLARSLIELAGEEAHVRAESRVVCWLAAQADREALTRLMLARWRDREDLPTQLCDGRPRAALPGAEQAPPEVSLLRESETPLVVRPVAREGTRLRVVAFIRQVSAAQLPAVTASFAGTPVRVQISADPRANRVAAEACHDHSCGWLELDLPVSDAGRLRVEMTVAGLTRSAEIDVPVEVPPVLAEDPRSDDEIGPWAQHALQRWYAQPHPGEPDLAYFQAYTGQSATDSPLAIHRELRRLRPDIRIRWLVDSPEVPVPEGAEPVLLRSREWYATLARARWLVTNIEPERWFRRRPGQVLVQTWHGNPGKTMGMSAWQQSGFTPGQIEKTLDHGPRTWSLLVSPSPEMTGHYRREFGYHGPVADHGYPRDDELVDVDETRRAKARAMLGLAPGQTAVLYAPTWRSELATNYRRASLGDGFDVAAAAQQLGEGYVFLLRGHRFHVDRERAGARVLDVTDHPEVNDLIIAADAAVLDYSSIRFDFALTGRPMIFHVPDLERYTARRGFLYDYADSAPGPHTRSTEEVVAALRDLEALRTRYAPARARFHARFNAWQDGHAAERVVMAMLAIAEES